MNFLKRVRITFLYTFFISSGLCAFRTFEKLPEQYKSVKAVSDWTFIVYMAADNDLFEFAFRDLQEMMKIGSNKNLSIVVQIDGFGAEYKTKRLYVTQEAIYEIEVLNEKLDSGSDTTLIDCFKWSMEHYPAHHYALVLWNHGSGVLDPSRGRPFKCNNLFKKDPSTGLLELDRSVGFIEYLKRRGICFNDTYGTYLTHEKLDAALSGIASLLGRKIDMLAFDACLMAMVEIVDIARFYADFMVGSQEVEPGDGWAYSEVLAPLKDGYLTPREFAIHTVESYRVGYLSVTKDFTQSAIDLNLSSQLLDAIHDVSALLLKTLEYDVKGTVELALKISKDSKHCIHFSEPSYIDLHNFYSNLQLFIPVMQLEEGRSDLLKQLDRALTYGKELLEKVVIANVRGANLSRAGGLSIYFPNKYLDGSYAQTYFAKDNAWGHFLNYYI